MFAWVGPSFALAGWRRGRRSERRVAISVSLVQLLRCQSVCTLVSRCKSTISYLSMGFGIEVVVSKRSPLTLTASIPQ